MNFVCKKSQDFCRCLNIKHAIALSYNYQSNWQAEVCIKFIKRNRKKCYEINPAIYKALLQIRATLISPRLPNPATLLFNRPITGLLPKPSRPSKLTDNNENNHTALINRQPNVNDDIDAQKKSHFSTCRINCSGAMQRWGTIDILNNNMMTIMTEATT